MFFYVPFHFFKVFFNFASVANAAFYKAKAHTVTPKGGKMSFLSFSNRTGFFHAVSFFQSPFRLCLPSKSSISQG